MILPEDGKIDPVTSNQMDSTQHPSTNHSPVESLRNSLYMDTKSLPQTPMPTTPYPTNLETIPHLTSHHPSPSITNLGHRSVVKQRLAQIEEVQTPMTSKIPSNNHHLSPASTSLLGAEQGLLARQPSIADSFIDSYCTSPTASRLRNALPPVPSTGLEQPNKAQSPSEECDKLAERITSIQTDLQILTADQMAVFTNIRSTVSTVDTRILGNEAILKSIRAKLEELSELLRTTASPVKSIHQEQSSPVISATTQDQTQDSTRALLASEFPIIKQAIQDLAVKIDKTTLGLIQADSAPSDTDNSIGNALSPLNIQVIQLYGTVGSLTAT